MKTLRLNIVPNSVTRWPKVRTKKNGSYVIHGRCLGSVRWQVMRKICHGIIRFTGLQQFLFGQGGLTGWMIDQLLAIRWFLRFILVEQYPHWGQAIYYSGQNPNDWHLVALGLLTLFVTVPLGIGLTFLLSILFWPLVAYRIKLTVTPEMIFLHRWWGRVALPRTQTTGERISFRTAEVSALKPLMTALTGGLVAKNTNKPSSQTAAVVMQGLRNHIIASPLISGQADRIVSVCHHTLNRSRSLSITSF